jgi:hypothetical protein
MTVLSVEIDIEFEPATRLAPDITTECRGDQGIRADARWWSLTDQDRSPRRSAS